MKMIERQSLIIWLYSTKNIKQLRKHGYIYYVSRRLKYAVMYINKDETDRLVETIQSYYFVREVELSPRDDIDMTFSNAIEYTPVDPNDDLQTPEGDDEFIKSLAKSIQASYRKENTEDKR